MKVNRSLWTGLSVFWFGVFTITSLYGLFVTPPYRTLVEGVPLYVSYFTVLNVVPILLMMIVMHFLAYTHRIEPSELSRVGPYWLCWGFLMIFDSVDPTTWFFWIMGIAGVIVIEEVILSRYQKVVRERT